MPATAEVKTGFFIMLGVIGALVLVSVAMGLFRGIGG